MSEDMNKELETEVKAEEPVETMEDYAAELEASYAALDQRRDMPEDDSAEGQKWAEFAQMMEDKTVLKVKISEAVKGGVVAFVDEVRAFIPASQLSADYVEKLEDWQGKHVEAVIITVDPEKKRLVLSGRQVERQKREEARKERLAQFKPGDVVEGTVDSLKDYGTCAYFSDQYPAHQASGSCSQGRTDRKGKDPFHCRRKDQPEHEGSGRAGDCA